MRLVFFGHEGLRKPLGEVRQTACMFFLVIVIPALP
jgi:hypothetical protein